ncbi:TonB-dependent receptor [Paraneptunicella aestuarii]|uniref:TonB-dependent receptor n=1 Tax=Paraneptunicella aestuarii TaxID=2831148 RepID=UPI001E38D2EA|nr:TonB-dependent receptor [Paraneptunicella aestuarii]UAA38879.1 TonB-dependent receptor [Paraneptunicella aestuarii]
MLTQKCLYTGFVLSAFSAATIAQQQDTASNEEVEKVVVYAQKRAQDIAEVAVPVTVISGQTLQDLHIKDTTQISSMVPNLKITNNAGEGTPPAFNIRGIGMIDYNTSTVSPVSIYTDGVVSGSANNLSSNLFDVEHIEVLKGPQGTLFGRNTTAGAVIVRSNMPEAEFGGYIKVGVAEHDHTSAQGAVNIPGNQAINSRFAFNYENYDFSVNNLMPGAPDGGLKQVNLRWITTADFDSVNITAKLHKDDWSGSPKPIESNGIVNSTNGGICTPEELGSPHCVNLYGHSVASDDFWDVHADTADRSHDTDIWGGSLKIEWEMSEGMTLTSITGYRDMERFHSWDSDGPGNFIEGTMDTDNELFSQELSVSIESDKSYWITGLFYLNEEIGQENSIDIYRDLRPDPVFGPFAGEFFYHNTLENESIAVYSQVDYELSDSLTLTAGLRFTDESTKYTSIVDLDSIYGLVPGLWNADGEVSDSEFSGKLALVQKLSKDFSMYYSYSRGYKSGGYNGGYNTSEALVQNAEYRPEFLDALEVGGRWNFMDGDGKLNMSVFYYDYQDQQVFVQVDNSGAPFGALKNAGSSNIYGLDAELDIAINENWSVDLNVGYLPEAEIADFDDGNVSTQKARLPFASDWDISGNLYWQQTFGQGTVNARIGFNYQSEFFFDQDEDPYTEQEAYTLWNGRISYNLDSGLSFGIWGKNLFDQEYSELRFDSKDALAAISELKGERRQLGVDVTYTF